MASNQPIIKLPDHAKYLRDMIRMAKPGFYRFQLAEVKSEDPRSIVANAYLHGVVIPVVAQGLSEAWGQAISTELAKDVIKEQFLREPIVNAHGEEVGMRTKGTSELDKADFYNFIENVREWAQNFLGVHVPAPNEYISEHSFAEGK